jgi:protein-S-isoprenylcysteine O-methyltransferase Ste14
MVKKHTYRQEQKRRDDLTGEHAVGDAGQMILAFLFTVTWIFDSFFLKYTTFRENPGVIRKSVFNIVRHPIYLSEILLYLGLLMLSISLIAVLVWVISILFLYYISRYEERMLLARFGEDYKQYMQEVPMFIPRLKKR